MNTLLFTQEVKSTAYKFGIAMLFMLYTSNHWMRPEYTHHPSTTGHTQHSLACTHPGKFRVDNRPIVHVFGLREKPEVPGENPHRQQVVPGGIFNLFTNNIIFQEQKKHTTQHYMFSKCWCYKWLYNCTIPLFTPNWFVNDTQISDVNIHHYHQ